MTEAVDTAVVPQNLTKGETVCRYVYGVMSEVFVVCSADVCFGRQAALPAMT